MVLIDPGGLVGLRTGGKLSLAKLLLRSRLSANLDAMRLAVSQTFYAEGAEPDPQLVEMMALGVLNSNPGGTLSHQFGSADFTRLKAPVSVFFGDKDVLFDGKEAVEQARVVFPNVEAELKSGEGHFHGSRSGMNAIVANRVSSAAQ